MFFLIFNKALENKTKDWTLVQNEDLAIVVIRLGNLT